MAHVVVVGEPDVSPAFLPGLDAHHVTRMPPGLEVLDAGADLVVIDARTDLTTAARLAPLLAVPVVLWTCVEQLDQVQRAWGLADVVVNGATAAEVAARVRLQLEAAAPTVLRAAEVVVDADAYRASVAGRPLDLTYTEFELLRFLVANPGRVHTRDDLLAEVWGYDYYGGTRTVDVHVRRLRAKLGPEHDALIETVRNVGYRFSPR